jgi:anti-sigma-K factor RskA
MKLARHRALDALCGEYLLGTLRGSARRRFERALRDEPVVAQRLASLERTYAPLPGEGGAVTPNPAGWARLRRELKLSQPWYARLGWPAWATLATAVVALGIALAVLRPPAESLTELAQLAGPDAPTTVTAMASQDRRTLALRAARPAAAPGGSSYELWLLPADGGPPISLGVLAALDARLSVPAALGARMRIGAKLAVSVEPRGGSPTGAPTGPVILVGAIS